MEKVLLDPYFRTIDQIFSTEDFKHLNQIWYIKTEELRELIKKENLRVFEKSGDEGSNTKGYEIPRDKYKHNFLIREIQKEWKG